MICEQEISFHIISNLIKGDYLNRYYKRLVKNAKPAKNNEVLKFCNQCDFGAFVSVDIQKFDCPVCNKSICAKCNRKFTENCCEDLEEIIDLEDLGEIKDKVVNCPGCKLKILKQSGCNFLRCAWPECRQPYFCFLCMKELTVWGI